jgi:hypothetical protein
VKIKWENFPSLAKQAHCFSLGETTVFEFVLGFLFLVVLLLDSNNAFTVSTICWWLLLLSSGDGDGFVLICISLTFKIGLRGPLKGPGHLIVLFLTFCNYFSTALVWFRSPVGNPPLFHLFDCALLLPFGSKVGRIHPYNLFLNQLEYIYRE